MVAKEMKPLFEPITIGGVEVRNRLTMAPMATEGIGGQDGSVSQREIAYYVERAKGGVGLIISGATVVDWPVGGAGFPISTIDDDCYIPGLSKLADAVHEHGAKMVIELMHMGRYRFVRETTIQPVAPSAIASRLPMAMPRALTTEEVEGLIEKYVQAAVRVKQAGFDGVDVLAGQGYLISTFLSPLTNERTDRFGGDTVEARATFLLEIIRGIKETVGNNFIICVKLSVDQFMPGGVTIDDSKIIARKAEEAGANLFNCYAGWHESMEHFTIYQVPRGAFVYLAEAIKGAVSSAAVGAVCRINDPGLAAQIIAEKRADVVFMARPLFVDPYLPKKAAEGKLEDIRMCIACNFCLDDRFGNIMAGRPEAGTHPCAVNAEVCKEIERRTEPTATPKKVLVVGGGPGGMEAARVAALRGHKVTLWEAKDRLGGALIPAAIPPHKQELNTLISYLATQIQKLGVKVELNKEGTPEAVLEESADEVVIATGSSPVIPEIPGIDGGNVVTAVDVLLGNKEVGERVVVIGGRGLVGCETAEFLAARGKKVTLIARSPKIAMDMGVTNRRAARERILGAGIEVLISTETTSITETGVTVEEAGKTRTIEADTVVLARGFKPNRSVGEALRGKIPSLHVIGDSLEPRGIYEAVNEGWAVGCDM